MRKRVYVFTKDGERVDITDFYYLSVGYGPKGWELRAMMSIRDKGGPCVLLSGEEFDRMMDDSICLGRYKSVEKSEKALARYTKEIENMGEPCYITKDQKSSYRLRGFEKFSVGWLEAGKCATLTGHMKLNSILLGEFKSMDKAEKKRKKIEKRISESETTGEGSYSLEDLETIMKDHEITIRVIPNIIRGIYEASHKDQFPNGKIEYLEEYKRDMLVVESIPEHAGEFIVQKVKSTSSTVTFKPEKYYGSLEEILEDF